MSDYTNRFRCLECGEDYSDCVCAEECIACGRCEMSPDGCDCHACHACAGAGLDEDFNKECDGCYGNGFAREVYP